jgi:uncharacterized repeat protein (TIGR03943 family)
MRRDTQALLLLLLGGTLLRVSVADAAGRYVPGGLVPLLAITGLAVLAVAGQALWQEHHDWIRTLLARVRSVPTPAAPVSGMPASGVPASGVPTSGVPVSGVPVSGVPVSAGPSASAGPQQAHAGYALHEGHDTEEFELLPPGGVSALTAATVAMPVLAPRPAESDPARGPLRMWNLSVDPPASGAFPDSDSRDDQPSAAPPSRDRVGWLLLVPVLVLMLIGPAALGSFPASRQGTAVVAGARSTFGALPEGDPVRIGVYDYAARAVFDQGRSLGDRPVLLTGFVIEGSGGQRFLARMVVGCCAADGRPVKVGLAGDLPADLEADLWLEVEGTFVDYADRDPVNGGLIPYLRVTSVRPIPAPTDPYESR